MNRLVKSGVFLLLLAASAPAQEPERPTPILEQVEQSPLPAASKQQVRSAIEGKDYKTAETILVRAIEENPKAPELLTLAARVFVMDKNPANAAIAFKKAERLRPLSPADRFLLAMAYIGMGRSTWARPELRKLAEVDPANPVYPYWLARLDYDDHQYGEAVRRLRAVTASNPGFLKAWDNLGLSLEGTGELKDAVASYREAVRLNARQKNPSPWPPLNLGTLLTRMGELKEAEALLREAVGYDARLAEAHYRLGVNLHKQAQDEAAVAQLRQAVELDPSAPEPLYTLGQLYRERGDAVAAAEAFDRFKAVKKARRGI